MYKRQVVLPSFAKANVVFNYVTWFSILFIIASYIRLYPKDWFSNTKITGTLMIASLIISWGSVAVLATLSRMVGKNIGFSYFFVSDSNKVLALATGVSAFLLFKNIKIPMPYFHKILNDYFEDSEINAYEKKLLTGISKVSVTPYMEHIFAEVKDFTQYRGGLGYLFLESKVFELLSVYLSEVLELSILSSNHISISKSDRDSITEAKRIIDSQLAFAPSCEELAKKVNISVSKLTKGFNSLFGTSVHAYIIDQRLEKAAGLLLESDLNVSQIAMLVGYSKPSNFAAAFKKKYGVIPKNYKDENTIG